MGSPPKPNEVGSVGKGGVAERTSFPLKGEASDTELTPTRQPELHRGHAVLCAALCCPFYAEGHMYKEVKNMKR